MNAAGRPACACLSFSAGFMLSAWLPFSMRKVVDRERLIKEGVLSSSNESAQAEKDLRPRMFRNLDAIDAQH